MTSLHRIISRRNVGNEIISFLGDEYARIKAEDELQGLDRRFYYESSSESKELWLQTVNWVYISIKTKSSQWMGFPERAAPVRLNFAIENAQITF